MDEDKLICFTKDELLKPREIIIEIMGLMAEKGYTDFSGGNMALKILDKIYITQRHSAERMRWKLRPDDIIVTDLNRNVLEGRKEQISREGDLHFSILERFPDMNCTLHGNSFYTPLLVASGVKVTAATEVADYYKIKEIPSTPEEVEMLSEEEKNIVLSHYEDLKSKGEALVIIFPLHGLMIAAKDHNEAFSLLDAVEINSKFILYREMLKSNVLMSSILEKVNGDVNINSNASGGGATHLSTASVESDAKILTSEDIVKISKQSSSNQIIVNSSCIVTSLAENKAGELGVKIIKK